MNTHWLKVFIAAFFEVLWVVGLKHAYNGLTWIVTIIAIIISFYLMIMAGRHLSAGTVYAVFVGLGTAGTVFTEMIFFGEPIQFMKIFLIFLLLIGVMGLKLITKEKSIEGEEQ